MLVLGGGEGVVGLPGGEDLDVDLEFLVVDGLLGDQGGEVVPFVEGLLGVLEVFEEVFGDEFFEEGGEAALGLRGGLSQHVIIIIRN